MVKAREEEYFPRGRALASGTNSKSKKQHRDPASALFKIKKSDDLFQSGPTSKESTGQSTKNKKKKNKNQLTTEENEFLAGNSGKLKGFSYDTLAYDTLVEDTLSLGRVTRVKNHEIVVNLPGRVVGTVPASNISAPYQKVLDALTSSEQLSDVWYLPPEMFSVGQLVQVRVNSITQVPKGKRIILSTSPSDLHKGYNSNTIQEGMVFTAAVESIEDHGYIMDLGIPGSRAFLDKSNANKFIKNVNQGKPLGIGQLVPCQVTHAKVTNNLCNVKLNSDPKMIHKYRYPDEMGLNYNLLLPGMQMEGIVMETHGTGLKVHIMEGIEGQIHREQMPDAWMSPNTFEISSKVNARVLFILPNGTSPCLSLQTKLFPHSVHVLESSVKLGDNETVKIVRMEKAGLIVRFPRGEKGLVSLQRCSDDASWTSEHVKKKFPIGSSHICKVIDYNSMDGIFICSFQESLLSQNVVRIDQVVPGTVVSATIDVWRRGGALCKFGLLRGFIPAHHFGNIPVKNPSTKFPPGTHLRVKAIKVLPEEGKILFTQKKDLVRSDVPILSDINTVKRGTISQGVVHSVNNGGIILETIGGLVGFVPRKHLGVDRDFPVEDIPKTFFVGRILPFQVLNVIPEERKLILALTIRENQAPKPEKNEEETSKELKKKKKKSKSKKKKQVQKNENSESEDEQEEEIIDEPQINQEEGEVQGSIIPEVNSKKAKFNKNGSTNENITMKEKNGENTILNERKRKKKGCEIEVQNSNNDNQDPVPKKKKKNAEKSETLAIPNDEEDIKPEELKDEDLSSNGLEISAKSFWTIDGDESVNTEVNAVEDLELDENKKLNGEPQKRLTRKEKAKLKDKIIRETELSLADAEKKPDTEDDFDRFVLASPNSSLCWIKYMAFYLESGNIDKAREIGSRALKTILFREEQERFNVWVALLNLENSHGTEETMNQVFYDALRNNDAAKIYAITSQIYCASSKFEKAEELFKQMVKKFRDSPDVWIKYGQFLFRNKRQEEGRKLFSKAILNLRQDQHVRVISKFAQMEFEFGEVDKGCTMFEQLLGCYNKRIDLWLMYANTLAKMGQHEKAKSTLMKTIPLRIPPKKMKPIFSRLLEIDALSSDPDPEAIRLLAIEYTSGLAAAS